MRRCKGTGGGQRTLGDDASCDIIGLSSTIGSVERLTRLNEGTTESRVLQHEILLLLPEAFERFKAICTVVKELYTYFIALVQQRWASMPLLLRARVRVRRGGEVEFSENGGVCVCPRPLPVSRELEKIFGT